MILSLDCRILVGSCAGLLSGVMGQCEELQFGSATLNQNKDKGSDKPKKIVTGDTVGDPNNGHIWPCLYSMKLTAILSFVFGSAIVAHRIPREVHFDVDLLELLVLFQCLAFSVRSWLNQVESGSHFEVVSVGLICDVVLHDAFTRSCTSGHFGHVQKPTTTNDNQ